MTPTCILITAADAGFFDLARGCIESVRDKAEGQRIPIAFLDLGCTKEQIGWLRTRVDFIRQPDWEFAFPGRESARGYLKGLLCRPFLRKYFPDYDVYFWIDADTWIQDWHTVDLFVQGASGRRGLAIVPEIDRASPLQYGGLPIWWRQVKSFYADFFGNQIAETYCTYPLLNAGAFALHKDAPHWKAWEDCLRQALARKCSLLTDQMALNLVVYRGDLFNQTELLPLWCNWSWNIGMPQWDQTRRCLVEPYLPHNVIGIMHLTGAKYVLCLLLTTERNEVSIRMRYPPGPAAPIPQSESAATNQALPQGLSQKPNYPILQNNLGTKLALQGNLVDAEACFRNAIQLDPNLSDAHSNLANILGMQGKLDEAVASYRQALQLRPDFAEAHTNLGQAFAVQGKLDEAMACYRQALQLKPDFADAHNNLGQGLAVQGKFTEALASFRQALRLRPDYADARNNLAIAMAEQAKLGQGETTPGSEEPSK